MIKPAKIFKCLNAIKLKHASLCLAAGFLLSIFLPTLLVETVNAGQIQNRSIQISNSTVNAAGVNYAVSFKPATNASVGGIVVNFCSNSPLISDSCTAPAGLSLGATPTAAVVSGIGTGGSWGATTYGSAPYNTLFETNGTPQAITGTTTPIVVTISNVQNPTALGSFYARILTYDTQAHAEAYTPTAPNTGLIDAGGVALSTVQQITVTSKVQEEITFCVYTSTPFDNGLCTGTGNAVTLGDTNGVLSTSGPYVDNTTKYDIQTNASNGAVISFTGGTLTSGLNTIQSSSTSAMCSSALVSCVSSPGSAQFGLCTWSAAGDVGNLTPTSPYDDGNCDLTTESAGTASPGGDGGASFGFDLTDAANNSTAPYGSDLATDVAGPYTEGQMAFIGNIAYTSAAGIYTTILTFVATGDY